MQIRNPYKRKKHLAPTRVLSSSIPSDAEISSPCADYLSVEPRSKRNESIAGDGETTCIATRVISPSLTSTNSIPADKTDEPKIFAELIDVIRSLHLDLNVTRDHLMRMKQNQMVPIVDQSSCNNQSMKTENLDNLSPATTSVASTSLRQNSTVPLSQRIPLFQAGQVHHDGWTHQFTEGDPVVMIPENLKGTVTKETNRSVWVNIRNDKPPKLKRKHNVEIDVGSPLKTKQTTLG